MMDRHAQAFDGLLMLGRSVALMPLEAITGERACELRHQLVTEDLGDDGGRGDGQALGVALDDGAGLARQDRRLVAVDQREARTHRELLDRLAHRPERGVEDVVVVDAGDVGDADPDFRSGADRAGEALALLGLDLLRIGDAFRDAFGIENDGGGHDGTRQRPAACLVDAGNRTAMELQLHGLELESGLHPPNHSALLWRASRRRA